MFELELMSGDENEELTTRINAILDAALPPLRAEIDNSVRINAVSMQLAVVMLDIMPSQREDFLEAFTKLLRIHLESLEKHMAESAVNKFLDYMKAILTAKGSDNDTTH